MHLSKIEFATALAAWSVTVASAAVDVFQREASSPEGQCPDDIAELGDKLSSTAKIYCPGSADFVQASERWSALQPPKVNYAVVPGTEADVVETVKYANSKDLPFLAFNTAHGAITTLGRMTHGIEIYMTQLSSVDISEDGTSVTIGGGTQSKVVTDTLWEAGKQTVTGTCECVSYMGPALGGGHGWLQGHHGLIADQFISLNVVLADGSLETIDSESDLFWALKGAGHNFGIVTSATVKVFDIEHRDWAIETLIFSGDNVSDVYSAANEHLIKAQPDGIINWSYWLNNPDVDPNNPIILFWIIQEGVTAVDSAISKPFHDIGPLVIQPDSGDYRDLAAWTGIALDSPPCQKEGLNNPRFPLYLEQYDPEAMVKAYDLFSSQVRGNSLFNGSLFMFEGYGTDGVRAVANDSAAFAFREDRLLTAPLITYQPGGNDTDKKAADLGVGLRNILHEASGRSEKHVYVNYAFGDEDSKQWYGAEDWRQSKLNELKEKYDPSNKFGFYGPVVTQ